MADINPARELFRAAGLAFPLIPKELADRLEEQRPWVFSTRQLDSSPYVLQRFVQEGEQPDLADYAVLSHSGHGVNSYAIQYYLVYGALRMFLHLGWGGAYMDPEIQAEEIRQCFSIADQIIPAVRAAAWKQSGPQLTIVASHFYGRSYWKTPLEAGKGDLASHAGPVNVLSEAMFWLTNVVGIKV